MENSLPRRSSPAALRGWRAATSRCDRPVVQRAHVRRLKQQCLVVIRNRIFETRESGERVGAIVPGVREVRFERDHAIEIGERLLIAAQSGEGIGPREQDYRDIRVDSQRLVEASGRLFVAPQLLQCSSTVEKTSGIGVDVQCPGNEALALLEFPALKMQESEQVIGVEIAWIGTKNFAIQPRGLR